MTNVILNGRLFDSELRDLYVDTSTGSDTASGSQSDPLLTVQEAIDRFESPLLNAIWAHDDTRTVHVAGDVQETVLCRGHAGPGALKIISEDVVVRQTLTQSGSAATISRGSGAYYVRNRFTFAETISVSVTGDTGMYLFPPAIEGTLGSEFEEIYEYAPVVATGGSTLDVVLVAPGVLSGAGYTDGATIEVRDPVATWTPAQQATSRIYGTAAIYNPTGSPLVIEGFDARPDGFAQNANTDVFLVNGTSPNGRVAGGSQVVIQGCRFSANGGDSITPCIGPSVSVNGTILTGNEFRDCNGILFANCRFTDSCTVSGSSAINFYGTDSGTLNIIGNSEVVYFRCDITGTVLVSSSRVRVNTISVDSGASTCININESSSMDFGPALSNNQAYGNGGGSVHAVTVQGPNANLISSLSDASNFNFSAGVGDVNLIGASNITHSFTGGYAANASGSNVYEAL